MSHLKRHPIRLHVQLADRYVLVSGELYSDRTLANTAEGVIAYLRETGALFMAHDTSQCRRVLYEDSEGVWDEMVHDGQRFAGFAHVGSGDATEAIVAASRHITCPRCLRTSHNPNDVRERYCGACHEFFGVPKLKPMVELICCSGRPGPRCCPRAGEYNGFGGDGPTSFQCPNKCPCHD